MTTPSIKGVALVSVVADIVALRDDGRLSAEELEARLEPEDLALLHEKLQPALWYPVESYRRMSELLLEVEGKGDPGYLVARGEAAARRIFDSGVYVQLQHGEERFRAARQGGRPFSQHDGRLVVSLAAAMYNFGTWTYRIEGEESIIDILDAADYPEVSVHSARGFLEYTVSRLRGIESPVRGERPRRDLVRFRFPKG